ncbi:hypothetical protein XH87_00690 [Bradyrhizobium sp. CCBAU 53415]|nr:hypothetical protein [Bradyrhizobium sp. CCBAU 53415]
MVEQLGFQWRRVPDVVGNEMVQLIVVARGKALRHRLNAFTITGIDQSGNVQRTHPLPGLMTQPTQQRLQSAFELVFPFRHGQPSESRPPMNH